MKKLMLFLLISRYALSFSYAQDHVQQLITEIKAAKNIQCYYLGSHGSPSALFMKADTLSSLLTIEEQVQLFADTSRTLKYYCYHHLLSDKDNDSIAFNLLKQVINDTTEVEYLCSCFLRTRSFNGLLVEKYAHFMQAKYKDGNPTVLGGDRRVYMFPKPDKKTYKEKIKQLRSLIEQSASSAELLYYLQ
ncbi:MAG: hypothetical protein ACTHJT_01190 [Cytophaga sp.]|uniref:hypothetical protein n=1 Tax=Cytophaga sp. TaxID=29535 RepID=UPI003F7F41C4